jgi:hypothetical protein
MTDMNSIFLSILLVLGSALIVVIILLIVRVSKTVAELQNDLTTLNKTLVPLLERIDTLAESTKASLDSFAAHGDALGVTLENIRTVSGNIRKLEEIVQVEIEPSLRGLASLLRGFQRGIQTFADNWRRSH